VSDPTESMQASSGALATGSGSASGTPALSTDSRSSGSRNSGSPVRWVALCAGVVAVALLVLLATRERASDDGVTTALIGREAPEIESTDVLTGQPFRLSALSGRYLIVNFFATWCTPCIVEHPELVKFAAEHKAAGDVAVVSVVFRDRADDVQKFFAARGGDWPVVASNRAVVEYGVTRVPETYLVRPDGIVVAKFLGVTQVGLDRALERVKAAA
jgi:cytochrome c biogenesis protein CcmG, thiol:disulfide interchange protein DsbE